MVSVLHSFIVATLIFVVCLDVATCLVRVSFTLYEVPRFPCIGGNEVGLTNTSVQFQYRITTSVIGDWITLDALPVNRTSDVSHYLDFDSTVEGVQFRFLQLEHGGGECNCWDVESFSFSVNGTIRSVIDCFRVPLGDDFCNGNARDARGVISNAFYFLNNMNSEECPGDSNSKLISDKGPPLLQDCSTTTPRIEVDYGLINHINGVGGCRGIDNREPIEFAMRNDTSGSGQWIPLQLLAEQQFTPVIRGYDLSDSVIIRRSTTGAEQNTVYICGDILRTTEVQFRWMGTADFNRPSRDMWALARVNVTLIYNYNTSTNIFYDGFGCNNAQSCSLNSSLWKEPRRGNVICTECANTLPCMNNYLTFGTDVGGQQIASRIAITQGFQVTIDDNSSQTVATETPTTASTTNETPTTMSTTTEALTTMSTTTMAPTTMSTTTMTPTTMSTTTMAPTTMVHTTVFTNEIPLLDSQILQMEAFIQNEIKINERLNIISEAQSPLEAINSVQRLVSEGEPLIIIIYQLGRILNRFSPISDTGNLFSKAFLGVGNLITQQTVRNQMVEPFILGSSLLSVFDRLPLEVYRDNGNISIGNIVLSTHQLLLEGEASILFSSINSTDFTDPSLPEMSLQIPLELVQMFASNNASSIRAVAFLYYNVSDFFPRGQPENKNGTELASGIVSTSLQCGSERCPTDDVALNTPIRVYFEHSDPTKEAMLRGDDSEITCVFWDFLSERSSQNDVILSAGQWSDRGCKRSDTLSNSSMTVCECNHLTHFAILLSPRPLNITPEVKLSLQILGYVGVSVSLVVMTITVIAILALKSLRNMRNIIHVNLCISLGIAQLIFVIGVTRVGPRNTPVPIHCQVIAVLIHYFFLVSFMWMLMEGVILYVLLVRVFIKHTKRYLIAFTIISYGVPLLYMALLTLPLGFALPRQPNYGYSRACFLNPETHFIWAFITPVIVLILANTGFFIMATTITWKHQKKLVDNTKLQNIKNWLKSAVSLVVVMGLTWIFGILIVEVKALLPLAYIYTIMVAFQGLFIFLIFVVFSKQVREAYSKWWRIKVRESDLLSKYFGEKSLTRKTATAKSKSDGPVNNSVGGSLNSSEKGSNHLLNNVGSEENLILDNPYYMETRSF